MAKQLVDGRKRREKCRRKRRDNYRRKRREKKAMTEHTWIEEGAKKD